jgi:hypothetical protein
MTKSPVERIGNLAEWAHQKGDQYVVTGVTTNGKRFRRITDNWIFAEGINLWRGSKWLLRDGKRYLLNRFRN